MLNGHGREPIVSGSKIQPYSIVIVLQLSRSLPVDLPLDRNRIDDGPQRGRTGLRLAATGAADESLSMPGCDLAERFNGCRSSLPTVLFAIG